MVRLDEGRTNPTVPDANKVASGLLVVPEMDRSLNGGENSSIADDLREEQESIWTELLLDKPSSMPWFLVGDFNVIVNGEEKRGGLPFRPTEGLEFLNFMSLVEVCDAGFSGSRFTWCNNRQGSAQVWKRLDRLLLNSIATRMANSVLIQHLGRDPSDHSPLLLSTSTRLDNKPKPFCFLKVWTSKEGFLDVINDS
ncbi:uncharacterized protein [Coffea arabica]|uniref:Endonuclease/exonuclease/phosphatase domain-containing protein n=1 Tax=Coffea arabica TaxID=13443 RepID=A0ABM4VBY9_COFAR